MFPALILTIIAAAGGDHMQVEMITTTLTIP
jgi:hypothetical protein